MPKNSTPIDKDKVLDTVRNVISMQQSERQRLKSGGLLELYSAHSIGKCSMCKREDIMIVKKNEALCAACLNWCRNHLIAKYGFYSKNKIVEAMGDFLKPMLCRFHDICGNELSRLKENGLARSDRNNICDRCRPIFKAGYESGISIKKRSFMKGKLPSLYEP